MLGLIKKVRRIYNIQKTSTYAVGVFYMICKQKYMRIVNTICINKIFVRGLCDISEGICEFRPKDKKYSMDAVTSVTRRFVPSGSLKEKNSILERITEDKINSEVFFRRVCIYVSTLTSLQKTYLDSIIHSMPYLSLNIPKYVPHGLSPIIASICPPIESPLNIF